MSRHLLCALLVTAACHRQTGPDAHYQNASKAFQSLYASQLDDAYGDAKMDPIVAELKQVDPRSVDAQPAAALLDNIERGRAALAKERAERQKLAAVPQAIQAPAASIDPARVLAAAEPDAGAPADPYGAGADVSAINAQTGGCISSFEPFNEQGTGVAGTVYRVVDSDTCKGKLPGFVGQAVLVVNGKIYRRIADPNPPPPPKPPAPRDAGPAQGNAAPPPRPAGVDAGEPQYQMYLPGMPQPPAQGQQPAEQQQR